MFCWINTPVNYQRFPWVAASRVSSVRGVPAAPSQHKMMLVRLLHVHPGLVQQGAATSTINHGDTGGDGAWSPPGCPSPPVFGI